MWYEKSSQRVAIISPPFKPDTYLQSRVFVDPIFSGIDLNNSTFIKNIEEKSSQSIGYLIKNYSSHIINLIKQNCPKVIPYYQTIMGKSYTINSQPGIHVESGGVEEDKLVNMPPEDGRECEKEFTKQVTIEPPSECNAYVPCGLSNIDLNQSTDSISINNKSNIEETKAKELNDEVKYTTRQERMPSLCESEDSFIVFEGSENSSDEDDDSESDEEDNASTDEDSTSDEDDYICNENNIKQNCDDSDINFRNCFRTKLKLISDVLTGEGTGDSKQVKFNRSNKQRQSSLCESEDSFIVFEGGDEDRHDSDSCDTDFSNNKISQPHGNKIKKKTEEEYKDSHSRGVVFERTEKGCEVKGSVNSEIPCDGSYDEVDACTYRKCEEFRKPSIPKFKHKKVNFAPEDKLCKVYPMIKWSYAYQAARKGPWEMHARDRTRFKDRINRTENELKPILKFEHRDNIYKQRFATYT
ncbi:protein phosphatase 1 regulatory subunit 15 [Rhynchophorus ferrugineus]|uniref:protein phosphatase 1 regulatory subunit 15 n=1 Tax=Rhynchophorus ferrugineus TaxID=354439 RepID=UPI003FCE6D13